jgi:hypothetical protein
MLVHFGDSCRVCLAAAMHAAATNDGFTGIRHTSAIRCIRNLVTRVESVPKLITYTFPNALFATSHISLGTTLIYYRQKSNASKLITLSISH